MGQSSPASPSARPDCLQGPSLLCHPTYFNFRTLRVNEDGLSASFDFQPEPKAQHSEAEPLTDSLWPETCCVCPSLLGSTGWVHSCPIAPWEWQQTWNHLQGIHLTTLLRVCRAGAVSTSSAKCLHPAAVHVSCIGRLVFQWYNNPSGCSAVEHAAESREQS